MICEVITYNRLGRIYADLRVMCHMGTAHLEKTVKQQNNNKQIKQYQNEEYYL